jgi:hypothetical protein
MKGLMAFFHSLLLFSFANGFSVSLTSRRQSLKHLSAASDFSSIDKTVDRRDALASLLLVTTAMVGATVTSQNIPVRLLSSVDEALASIESECDRRFLHGVVASGYNLMYRAISTRDSRYPMLIQSEASDSVLSSHDFASLERDMANQTIKPSNALLAVTSPGLVDTGVAASVWPLGDNVHFAWTEDGALSAGKIIVDGVDCGRMSLEDALEGQDREIMFRADRFLAVPIALEAELLAGLRNAFII